MSVLAVVCVAALYIAGVEISLSEFEVTFSTIEISSQSIAGTEGLRLGIRIGLNYVRDLAVWVGCSAIAYWLCGWMSNQYGKKLAVPLFAGVGGCFFLAIIFGTWTQGEIFWLGLGLNFFVTGHYGSGSYAYVNELFPAQIRGSVQASFAIVVGFVVSFVPTIPPWIAGDAMDHISRGFVFPMVLTFPAAGLFLFICPGNPGAESDCV